ncbi:hypothetical protein [uncultured Sulfitobacter sp.]|uniref:NfeD family protein n=1 Tax=uncultured Sulfitobacter sp. TaxID=191468 RepID=UPI002628C781|nr:hypothetical protein [uncultured Sulfitobacter sp.]
MAEMITLWWIWLAAALVLALVELVLPGSIFLGFALGALAMAGIVALFALTNTAALVALFAGLSLFAWIILRFVFKRQSSGARIVTRDINDN